VGKPLGRALALKTPDWKPLVEHFRSLYLERYLESTRMYDGVGSVLAMLRSHGKKVGIVTLKSNVVAREVLRGLNIHDFIDAVEGDDDVSELKPAPDHVLRVCMALNVTPGRTVMVGDTTMDITAGKDAGCRTIGVLWGAMSIDELAQAGADLLARDPKELEDILMRL
jgi:HAD superfamily hydrolase (TIGR01509 family)